MSVTYPNYTAMHDTHCGADVIRIMDADQYREMGFHAETFAMLPIPEPGADMSEAIKLKVLELMRQHLAAELIRIHCSDEE